VLNTLYYVAFFAVAAFMLLAFALVFAKFFFLFKSFQKIRKPKEKTPKLTDWVLFLLIIAWAIIDFPPLVNFVGQSNMGACNIAYSLYLMPLFPVSQAAALTANSDAICIAGYAASQKDVEPCASLYWPDPQEKCVHFAIEWGAEDGCDNITEHHEIRNLCFQEMANKTMRAELCGEMTNSPYKDECVYEIALNSQNFSACYVLADKRFDNYRSSCLVDFAAHYGDPSVCEQMYADSNPYFAACLRPVPNLTSICRKLKTQEEIQVCNALMEEGARRSCAESPGDFFSHCMASSYGIPALCGSSKETDAEGCMLFLALYSSNISLCESGNKNFREVCIVSLLEKTAFGCGTELEHAYDTEESACADISSPSSPEEICSGLSLESNREFCKNASALIMETCPSQLSRDLQKECDSGVPDTCACANYPSDCGCEYLFCKVGTGNYFLDKTNMCISSAVSNSTTASP
jgi:hypothetical protein